MAKLFVLAPIFGLALLQSASLCDEPAVSMLQVSSFNQYVSIGWNASPTNSDLLEVSSDLKTWNPYLNVFHKVSPVWVFDRGTVDAPQPHLFYRVNSRTVEGPSTQRLQWQKAGITNYTYTFKRTCFCQVMDLTAAVTVQNGKIASVEAFDGNQRIENPDLSQFPTIEQLFDLIESEQPQADLFVVGFDLIYHFPRVIDINYLIEFADDEIQYWASDVHPF